MVEITRYHRRRRRAGGYHPNPRVAEFYPGHIAKEDKLFFPNALAYVTPEEDQAMLAVLGIDRRMIHENTRPWSPR